MNKIIVAALATLCTLSSWAQSADERAGACLSESRWFDLYDVYQKDSTQMSPVIKAFSRAMTDQMFNRPAEACNSILSLIRNHQQQIGGSNVYSMMLLLAENYSRTGNNERAAAAVKALANQTQADSATTTKLRNKQKLYTALAGIEVNQTDNANHTLDFNYMEIGDSAQYLMTVSGKVNGHKENFIFDTGASYNVITPELARRYGLQIIDGDIEAKGTRTGNGKMAVAKDINIGSLHIRNAVFAVLDFNSGNERASRVVRKIQLILGQPILQLFGQYTIDCQERKIQLTHHSPRTTVSPNVYIDKVPYIAVTRGGLRMPFALDTGAPKSSLDNAYYKAFSADVAREGKWEITGAFGFGGITYDSVFRMPQVDLTVDNNPFSLRNIAVSALSSGNQLTQGYGRLGIDFIQMWHKVTVDNTNMTITLE